jgi:hypothetical protein
VNSALHLQPQRVPTLTEVVQLPQGVPIQGTDAERLLTLPATVHAPAPIDEAALCQRVLLDVQRQVDLMLEYRLREALAPMLGRLAETLVREARDELALTLRDVVARAVNQEVARNRPL